ncbi:hypothetical protein [Spirosoma oryzicola]|uniref:hypothetical protein n=1 Tax=Spirosoma oryzicola TaxID=2898794 RepID=UPI001E3763A2|nr:hypothetical protein [Spirosoma oryzicola]UHG94920.1 hypothetical protein LQ777_29870 [Spirosoma oryzicola]
MPQQPSHIVLSDEIQEIIGYVPHWVVRWGISAMFIVFLILLACSYLIRFPDTISAPVTVSATVQPFRISWYKSDVNVDYRCMVRNGQSVQIGDTVLLEENITNHSQVAYRSTVKGKVHILRGSKKEIKLSTILIMPQEVSGYEVQIRLPIRGSGKIKAGQHVLIRLDEYPTNEFGYLEGFITSFIPVSIDQHYRVNVQLSKGLMTTLNKKLPLQPELRGTAEVMLDEKKLLQRMIDLR